MTEAETRAELIDPALRDAGWVTGGTVRVAREYRLSLGRLQGGGRRSHPEIADYVLFVNDEALVLDETN